MRCKSIILPPQFLGSVDYYAAMMASDNIVIDSSMRFNKRFKSTHRTIIADANGTNTITVPIVKPLNMTSARWGDVMVSDHNQWWNEAFNALQSAYGRTPFFEFYADDFLPFFSQKVAGTSLMDYDLGLDALLRKLLFIEASVEYEIPEEDGGFADYRTLPIDFTRTVEYYQVRAQRHGFIPGLSIVDLLFNLGPEAALVLKSMVSEH